MEFHETVPIALFICMTLGITYIVRLMIQARLRIKMLQVCTAETVESFMQADARRDRLAALRWGILTALEAVAFGIIQVVGWTVINAGVVAVLLGAFGLGSLLFTVFGRRLS
ncbi:hypothetical protein DWU98_01805 [Dyella monticola]|uniref:Uncharacterized protein n=1 Tax=Dyella monticola TaxID=1927958 RepID=A0A370X8T6_9GAMM|nr:hypothetical protein [Dyella monticola]RDS84722.1 hypothetical protein DWU98_01805 [Dyella monticola]